MIQIFNLLFDFLLVWTIEVTLLVLLAGFMNLLLHKRAGSVQAAIWSTALILCWTIPFAPFIIPSSLQMVVNPPVYTQVQVSVDETDLQHRILPGLRSQKIQPAIERTMIPDVSLKQEYTVRPIEHSLLETPQLSPLPTHQQIKAGLFIVWLLGLLYFILHWLRLRRYIMNILALSQVVENEAILNSVERTRQLLFLEGPIEVRTADTMTAPFIKNLWRPLLFMPSYMIRNWNEREQLAVIAHELGHLRRYDYFFHLAMQALRIVFWFLPPVWWMQRELHRAQDSACDECAAIVLGSSREFGRVLTHLAEHCLIKDFSFPALGILHVKHTLIHRLENIMNTQIQHLTRLSLRYKLFLVIFALFIFSLGGSFSHAVFSQTLDLKFLSNYPKYAVEKITFAPPYFAVATRTADHHVITFYEWVNDGWVEHKQVAQKIVGDEELIKMTANEYLTVLVYKTNRSEMKIIVIEHHNLDTLQTYIISIPDTSNYFRYKLFGSFLYILGNHAAENYFVTTPTWFISQFSFENNQYSQQDYLIDQKIMILDFAPFESHFIIISDEYAWYATVQDNILSLSGTNMFYKNEIVNGKSEQKFLREVYNYNSQSLLIREINTETYNSDVVIDPVRDYDLLLVDWNSPTQPIITQQISAPTIPSSSDFYTLNGFIHFLEHNLIGLQGYHNKTIVTGDKISFQETESILFLFQIENNQFHYQAKVDNVLGLFESGHSIMIKAITHESFRITDSFTRTPVLLPYMKTPFTGNIGLANHHVYAIDSHQDQPALVIYNASLPTDIQPIERVPLAGSMRITGLHDGILSLTSSKNFLLYTTNSDGTLGETLHLPDNPEQPDFLPLLDKVLWNDSLFITAHVQKFPTGTGYKVDRKNIIFSIYQREDNQIGNLIKSFNLTGNAPIEQIILSENKLFVYKWGQIDLLGDSNYVHQVVISIISLENPQQPELLVDFYLPRDVITNQMNPPRISVQDPYLIASHVTLGTYVFDLSEPMNPTLVHTFDFADQFMNWYDDLLLLSNSERILFYQLNEDRQPSQIGELKVNGPAAIEFSGNRLYLSREQFGLDIYQITTSRNTEIIHWNLY